MDAEARIAQLERKVAQLSEKLAEHAQRANDAESGPTTFSELNVGRINVVDNDGTVRLVIHNRDLQPGPPTRKGSPSAGVLFFAETGEEAGGLIVDNTMALLMDQHRSDQVLGFINWEEDDGTPFRRGLALWDRPPGSLNEHIEAFEREHGRRPSIREVEIPRFFAGRLVDEARIALADSKGRDRLRLVVDAHENARIEFLDESGNVSHVFPEDAPGRLDLPPIESLPKSPDGETVAQFLSVMGNDFDKALQVLEEVREGRGAKCYAPWREWLIEAKRMNSVERA